MNFYKHHIGDYDQATRHLSFVEDAAYSRLIRKYYAEEKPLPEDVKKVQRLIGARSRDEKEAVETVLAEFFVLESDGWHNKRCDEEIAQANAQAETNRRIAREREEKKRQRKANETSTNRGHEDSTNRDEEKHDSWSGEKHDSFGSREPSQTPDSRLQTPDVKQQHNHGGQSRALETGPIDRHIAVAVLLRALGVSPMTGSHPLAMVFANAGATDEQLRAAVEIARERKPAPQPISPAYLQPILQDVLHPPEPRRSVAAASRDADRANTIAVLTGRTNDHERTAHTIDVEARHVD